MSSFEQLGKTDDASAGRSQRIIGTVREVLFLLPPGTSLPRTQSGQRRLRHLAMLWALGLAAMALLTWAGLEFELDRPGAPVLAYLSVVVLLSYAAGFITSVVFSVVALGCLAYFFAEPHYSFDVTHSPDRIALITFIVASLAISTLVTRVRLYGEAQRAQAQLLDLTTDAIFIIDFESHEILYWNHGAERLYGWKKSEALGNIAQDFLKSRFAVPLEEVKQALVGAGHWEGEIVHTARDGAEVTVASRWLLSRDEEGRPTGWLSSNTDITERKRAEEALRRSQKAYITEAQQLSHTGSFGWNVSNGEIFWSEESFRIFGYDPAANPSIELVLQRTHPEDVASVEQVISRAADRKEPFDLEHRLLMPDGAVKTLHVVGHPMTNEKGELQFVGAVMDVTASKAAEEKLQRLQAEFAHAARVSTLGELAASIAHELNQPLGAISLSGEAGLRWLDHTEPDLGRVRATLNRMHADARRASDIISRIRSMAARTAPERAPVPIDNLIGEALQFLHHESQSRGVTVSHHRAPAAPLVVADRTQLQQVIVNLAVNAMQAMAQAGGPNRTLTIRTTSPDPATVCCIVEDSGPGIEAGHMPRLFESFFTTKDGGMGMGLSICRSIVEAHGGSIRADNDSTHGGARFTLELPAADASG
jgi:PAS domain S-box-containing protein